MSEIPVHHRPRRLADWINPTGARKVHSLVDKVYQRKNLEMAWEKVKANRGSGGVDGQSLEAFAAQVDQQLDRLQSELKEDTYQPQPVRQVQIPKAGNPGEFRMLGVPTIYDRVCQQALLNRLEPIFEPIFDEANFGVALLPEPAYVQPRDAEWAYLVTSFSECIDSFFAFGLFELAKRSGFFPPELVETFEPVIQEESRHILLFANWIAWYRRTMPWYRRPWFELRVMAVWLLLAWERMGLARSIDHNAQDNNFTVSGSKVVSNGAISTAEL
jgi:hypothetical protein